MISVSLKNVTCELWVVENQDAKKHTAGFEDYKDVILDKIEEQAAKEKTGDCREGETSKA